MQILPIFLAAGDEPTRILFDIGVFAAGVFAFVKSFDWLRNRIDQSVDEHFKSAAINAAIAKAVAEEVAAKLAAERPRIVDEAVQAAERNAREKAGARVLQENRALNEGDEALSRTFDVVKKRETPP